MAQMAAQDYFSRLQMSGMMHPDLANLSALGNLASYSNAGGSLNSPSSNSKSNSKRKDKVQDSYDMKKMSSNDVRFFFLLKITSRKETHKKFMQIKYMFSHSPVGIASIEKLELQTIISKYFKFAKRLHGNSSISEFNSRLDEWLEEQVV